MRSVAYLVLIFALIALALAFFIPWVSGQEIPPDTFSLLRTQLQQCNEKLTQAIYSANASAVACRQSEERIYSLADGMKGLISSALFLSVALNLFFSYLIFRLFYRKGGQ